MNHERRFFEHWESWLDIDWIGLDTLWFLL